MAKRKRKAPKRRRRNRFGFIKEKVNEILGAIAEPVGTILGTDEFSDTTVKTTLETKLAGNAKKDTIIPNVVELKNILEEDFNGYATAEKKLGKTIEFFKQKANDGAEALYAMMDNFPIKAKIIKKIEEQTKKMPMITYDMVKKGFSGAYKLLPKGPVKLIGNIVGDAMTEKSVNGEGYRKQGEDKLYEIISLAQETAIQGGKAAAAAAKKGLEEEANKATTETKPATTEPKKEEPKKPKTGFGKRKRGPSASLKRMCKKHGVRLTVKRGKKRVYKSSKVLKGECQNKLKNKLIKNKKKINFGKKKIKRSSIMPQAKRSYGRKRRSRKRSSKKISTLRQVKDLVNRYKLPLGAAAGSAAAAGLYQRFAPEGYKLRSPLYYKNKFSINPFTGQAGLWKENGPDSKGNMTYSFRPHISGGIDTRKVQGPKNLSGFFPTVRSPFRPRAVASEEGQRGNELGYGKRRRRRRSFGKAKKPTAATRRMCKRLKVKMTLKRGGKRVYKSEAVLKKQCKTAMKRKSKK
tara:strand:- start:587 stop:2146 length:1560 start_codon:yes stop_codon:yes gene_type:complete